MNAMIAGLLAQDALTNGAIYALLAIVLVMVFSVTRVIFVPQGDFVSFAALTLAWLTAGRIPATLWLTVAGLMLVAAIDFWSYFFRGRDRTDLLSGTLYAVLPVPFIGIAYLSLGAPYWIQILATIAIIVPLGPIMYRLAFHPVANSSVLHLLIVAIAVHFLIAGLGLLFFGSEGVRNPAVSDAYLQAGPFRIAGQAIVVWAAAIILMIVAFFFFNRTLVGKALRATAFNRVGARLVGISPSYSGTVAFLCASFVGAITGILISSLTTIYYDTGFLIGLKGFVAAIVGALMSYPVAALGALIVAGIETASSFWVSTYKDVIIFAVVLPILLWQNLFHSHHDDEEEEE